MVEDANINPWMLILVREAQGLSQGQLARKIGMTQGFLSKIENGFAKIPEDALEELLGVLDCPIQLLQDSTPPNGLETVGIFHRRKMSRISVSSARKIEAIAHLTRITVNALSKNTRYEETNLKRLNVESYGAPDQIAQLIRATWNNLSEPINSMTELLDAMGVVVLHREFDSGAQDAFSTWPEGSLPIIVIKNSSSTDRERFTLAHELGHLIMHTTAHSNVEQQANLFAAELLMPAEEITPYLQGLGIRNFDKLIELKNHWKVSIAALVQRAKTLELISERQFREFRVQLSKLGWNTIEPINLPPEKPQLIHTMIQEKKKTEHFTNEQLAHIALMTPQAFYKHYLKS